MNDGIGVDIVEFEEIRAHLNAKFVTRVLSIEEMAIYDTMNFLKCDIVTYCVGQAASMATLLLAAGTKGKRYALPNSRVMMHQPTGGATGQTSDISIAAREILRWRKRMNELIASHTNKTAEEIASDSDRDFYLTAQDALEYGIVDKVIESDKGG